MKQRAGNRIVPTQVITLQAKTKSSSDSSISRMRSMSASNSPGNSFTIWIAPGRVKQSTVYVIAEPTYHHRATATHLLTQPVGAQLHVAISKDVHIANSVPESACSSGGRKACSVSREVLGYLARCLYCQAEHHSQINSQCNKHIYEQSIHC